MAKQRLNQDEAFQSLMGIKKPVDNDNPSDTEATPNNEPVAPLDAEPAAPTPPPSAKESKEKLLRQTFYISEKHRKALKMKMALSDKPEDKDYSAIIQTALDIYLADILKDL
jgi:hypothetical protein